MTAETIDSLLVSLGLDVDQKSFQKATDALTDIKNKSIQLLSAAGIGIGFDALTRGVAGYTTQITNLSYAAKTSTRDIEALRLVFKAQGRDINEADAALSKMADLQRQMAIGNIPAIPGVGEIIGKSPLETLEFLAEQLPTMEEGLRIRSMLEVGITPGSSLEQMMMRGGGEFQQLLMEARMQVTGISPELLESTSQFNKELANIQNNFNELSKVIGGPLLNELNNLLKTANDFIKENKEEITEVTTSVITGDWYNKLMDHADRAGKEFRNHLRANDLLMSKILGPMEDISQTPAAAKAIAQNIQPPGDNEVIQRAQKAKFPGITSAAESRYGLPPGTLSAIMQVESGGNRFATSPAGAQGPFQFMPETAKEFGLSGSDVFDVEKSADAAGRYMRQLLNRYGGNMEMALAAYNWGMGNVERKGLAAAPKETREYVPKVLSLMGQDHSDALATATGQFNSPSQALPSSAYSASTQSFTQTNHVTIQTGANAEDTAKAFNQYSKNAADWFNSDIY